MMPFITDATAQRPDNTAVELAGMNFLAIRRATRLKVGKVRGCRRRRRYIFACTRLIHAEGIGYNGQRPCRAHDTASVSDFKYRLPMSRH